jgi:hypothetical protein
MTDGSVALKEKDMRTVQKKIPRLDLYSDKGTGVVVVVVVVVVVAAVKKVMFTLEQAMKAQTGSRGTALLFL